MEEENNELLRKQEKLKKGQLELEKNKKEYRKQVLANVNKELEKKGIKL